eukprot:4420463-Amphidinium_carterae.1
MGHQSIVHQRQPLGRLNSATASQLPRFHAKTSTRKRIGASRRHPEICEQDDRGADRHEFWPWFE